jgi:hypothetical protein
MVISLQIHIILNRRKNYFCRVLNAHVVNDVRQTEIHTAELFVPSPNCFEFEIATEKVKTQIAWYE